MKKIWGILLSIMLIASLAGCSGKKDPKEIYDEAAKRQGELSSMDVDTQMEMSMAVDGENVDMTSTMNIKVDGVNTDSMHYLVEGTANTMGQNMDMLMYYENGYCYMDMMGQKIKFARDLEEITAELEKSLGASTMDSSYMKEITAEKDGDNRILSFVVDESKMKEFVDATMDVMGGMAEQLENADYSMEIKALSGESVVNKEGYFISSKVNMTMEMTAEGQTVSMDAVINAVFNNPGQEISVTPPDGLDSYMEVDASLLGL